MKSMIAHWLYDWTMLSNDRPEGECDAQVEEKVTHKSTQQLDLRQDPVWGIQTSTELEFL